MPRSSRYRLSAAGELPRTLQRSSREAQAIFLAAHVEAVRVHGPGDEADQAAYQALKDKFEKRGDEWIAKAEPAA
jgi:ChaB protein